MNQGGICDGVAVNSMIIHIQNSRRFDLKFWSIPLRKLVAQLVCGFKIEVRLAVIGSGKKLDAIPFSSSTLRIPVRSTGQNPSTGDGGVWTPRRVRPGSPRPVIPSTFLNQNQIFYFYACSHKITPVPFIFQHRDSRLLTQLSQYPPTCLILPTYLLSGITTTSPHPSNPYLTQSNNV